jgi:hypothetical protein
MRCLTLRQLRRALCEGGEWWVGWLLGGWGEEGGVGGWLVGWLLCVWGGLRQLRRALCGVVSGGWFLVGGSVGGFGWVGGCRGEYGGGRIDWGR